MFQKGATESKSNSKSGVVKENFTLVVCWNKCIDSYDVNIHFHAHLTVLFLEIF